MDNRNNQPSMEQAMALAASPAGQKLIGLLRQRGGADFQKAVEKASQGDPSQAKQILSSLLSSQEAQELMKQLKG